MVLGIRTKSRKTVANSIQVNYIINVYEIKPWPPSQSLRSVQSVLLQWQNGDQNSGSLASSVCNGKIEFNAPFKLSVFMFREASKKGKTRESFQKNYLEFHLYDRTVKSQLLGSATINFADFGIIKETKAISFQLNCKKSFRSSAQPFMYVSIQPFDNECSSSSPDSNLSKELSLEKEESESVSQSVKDDKDDLEIASFTDDEEDDDDDTAPNTLQTIRSASDTIEGSTEIREGGAKDSNEESIQPSESTTSSLLVNTKAEASTQVNDIKSPTLPMVLCSDMGNVENGRPSSPKISEGSVKVANASSEIQESIQQSCSQDITGDMFKAISPSSYISSRKKPHLKMSFQSHGTSEDSISQEDITRNWGYEEDSPKKVNSVSNIGVMEDKEKIYKGRNEHEKFTARNEILENVLDNNFSDDESTRARKLNSDTRWLSKESHEHPTEQEEKMNTLNDVHVGAACHNDISVNGSFLNDNTELKAEVERLREELREAAALEASMYSVIAEHGSSNKVHAPARRLSRLYFHARRVGSPAKIASAAQSALSGFVLVSKACGNDVPRLTFWFSNLISLRAIVSKEVENKDLGDDPCIHGECYVNGPSLHDQEKENTEAFHSWLDPKTFLVALEKVEAWMFSRIVESVWWQTLTPYMQSAATKSSSSSSRKIHGKRYNIGDQDQGNFSIDLWKRAFKDACERLCPLRAGGLECGCLPLISRMVMEQLVNRLDVAMFNAILRESDEEMPTDPISDPISDSKVLPIPAGKSGFGAGAQLKNAIGDWSRWLSDLFGIDDCDSHEDINENDNSKFESPFKPFPLLNALSDLMMLPFDMLADSSMRKEVCPRFGIPLIKQVVYNFVPDEFSPGPVPNAVLEALNNEDIEDDEESITSFPCTAGSTFYSPPPGSSVVGMLKEVGTPSLKSGSYVLKKLYTSDDELDELDSPPSALGMDDPKKKFAVVKGGRKVVRYELLREVWKSSE